MVFNHCSSNWVKFGFKTSALCLALAFIFPSLAWTFEEANYAPSVAEILKQFTTPYGRIIDHNLAGDPQRLIIQIQDVHNDYGAQKNIQKLITHIAGAGKVSLLAIEGSAQSLELQNLRAAPYPQIKNRLYNYFMRSGYLSGAEAAALTLPQSGIQLFGIEDPAQYAESLRLARDLLRPETQRQLSQLRFLYEDLKDKLTTAELDRLDATREEFLNGKLDIKDYITFLLRQAPDGDTAQAVKDELGKIDSTQNLEPAEWDVKLRAGVQALKAGLLEHDARRLRFEFLRQELDMLERMFALAAFPEDVAYIQKGRPTLTIREYIDFYTEQAPSLDLPLEFIPDTAPVQQSLDQARQFYALALARNQSLVNNLVQRMETANQNRAVLLVGGFHTPGIQQVLRQGGWSYVTLRPALDRAESTSTYAGRLTGKPGLFRSLTGRSGQKLLAASSVFERGPEHQDFWQEFACLYLAQVAPLLAKADFRESMTRIAESIGQGLPYPVRVDADRLAVLGGADCGLLPLQLTAPGRNQEVTAVRGRLQGPKAQPFLVYPGKPDTDIALYALPAALGMKTQMPAQTAVPLWLEKFTFALKKQSRQIRTRLQAVAGSFRPRIFQSSGRLKFRALIPLMLLGWLGGNDLSFRQQGAREQAWDPAWPRIPLDNLVLGKVISDTRSVKVMAAEVRGRTCEFQYDKAFDDDEPRYYQRSKSSSTSRITDKLILQAGHYQALDSLRYENKRIAPAVLGLVTGANQETVGYLLEPTPGADLFTLMDERGLDEQELKEALRQVEAQLLLMHARGLGHHNLQAENVRVEIKSRDPRQPIAERISARLVNFMPLDPGVKFNPIHEMDRLEELREELNNWNGRPERQRRKQTAQDFRKQYGHLLSQQNSEIRGLAKAFHGLEPSLLSGKLTPVRQAVCDLMDKTLTMEKAETYAAYEAFQADFQKACARLNDALGRSGLQENEGIKSFLQTLSYLQKYSRELIACHTLTGKIRALPAEAWLGPEICRTFGGAQAKMQVLELKRAEDLKAELDKLGKNFPGTQNIIVRLVENAGLNRFILAIDTPDNFRQRFSASADDPIRAFYFTKVLNEIIFIPETDKAWEIRLDFVYLEPHLQGRRLGEELVTNVCGGLSKILPEATITCSAEHPATAHMMIGNYQAGINWRILRDYSAPRHEFLRGMTALGLITLEESFSMSMDKVKEILQQAKTRDGLSRQDDLAYLLDRIRDRARNLMANPENFAGLAKKHYFREDQTPQEWQEQPPDLNEWTRFLFSQVFFSIPMIGKVPDEMSFMSRPNARGEMRLMPLRIIAGFAFSSLGLLWAVSQGDLPLLWLSTGLLGLWVFTYLPRLAYLALLSRSHAPPLTPERIAPLLEELEARGGLPENYQRPVVTALEQPTGLSWRQSVLLGQGELTPEGPQVKLHPKFLALPFPMQLAVLRHEIDEAHDFGHWRATWAEYTALARQAAAAGLMNLLRILPRPRLRPVILALLVLLPQPAVGNPAAQQPRAWDDGEISAWTQRAANELERYWNITEGPGQIADKATQLKMALALVSQHDLGAMFIAQHFKELFTLDADVSGDRGRVAEIALACARKDASVLEHLNNFHLNGRGEDKTTIAAILQAAAAQNPEIALEHAGQLHLQPGKPEDRELIKKIALACLEKDPGALLRGFKNTGLQGNVADHLTVIAEIALACIRLDPEGTADTFHQFQLQGRKDGRPALRQRLLLHIFAQAIPHHLNVLVKNTRGKYDVLPKEFAAYVQGLLDFAAGQGVDIERLKSSHGFNLWFRPWLERKDLRRENRGQASRFFKLLCEVDDLRSRVQTVGSRIQIPQLKYLGQFTQPASEACDQLTWYERFYFAVMHDLPAGSMPAFAPYPQLDALHILPLRWLAGREEAKWREFAARLQNRKLSAPVILRLSEVCARLRGLGIPRETIHTLVAQALELESVWTFSERLNSILFAAQGEHGADAVRALALAGASAAWPQVDIRLLNLEEMRGRYSESELEQKITALNHLLGWENHTEDVLRQLGRNSGLTHLVFNSREDCVGYFIANPHSKQEAALSFFAVHPQYQGLDLSQMLFFTGMKAAQQQGFQAVFLEYDYRNAGARNFYLQQGLRWQILKHERAGFYSGTGHPCMYLSYRLPPPVVQEGEVEETDMDTFMSMLGIEEGIKADPANMLPFLYEHPEQAAAVGLQEVQPLLLSRDPERIKLGLEAVALQYARMPFEALELFTLTIMQLLEPYGFEIQQMGLQVLQRVQPRFRTSAMRLLLAECLGQAEARLHLEPWMVTGPERLAGVASFLVSFAPIRGLLSDPRGAIVQDVGSGGAPYPYTMAGLAQTLHALNPKIRIEATDIVDPAALLHHAKTGQYTYFDTQGRPLNTYVEGAPAASPWVKPMFVIKHGQLPVGQEEMQSIFQNHLQGKDLPAGFSVVQRPLQTYAKNHGFTYQRTAFGRGTQAQVKVSFNMIYMYPGRETVLVREIGQDLDEGGFLLIGNTVAEGEPRSVFTLYQKRSGEMKPEGVYVLTQDLQVRLPLRGERWTIQAAEELTLKIFRSEETIPELETLKAAGLKPKDAEVTDLPPQPEIDLEAALSLEGKAAGAKGRLNVSWLRAAGGLLVSLGWYALFPDSALGAFPALAPLLAWGSNYLPRLAYLALLSGFQALPLTPGSIRPLLEQLEVQGGLPANYQRPAVSNLDTSHHRNWWESITLGQGGMTAAGPMVKLHPKFRALPRSVQLAILRHEIVEAHAPGAFKHWRATLQEYRQLAGQVIPVSRLAELKEGLTAGAKARARAALRVFNGKPFRLRTGYLPVFLLAGLLVPKGVRAVPDDQANLQEMARSIRAISAREWMGTEVLAQAGAGGDTLLTVLETDRLQTLDQALAGLPARPAGNKILVRAVETNNPPGKIRLTLLLDTLENMRALADKLRKKPDSYLLREAEVVCNMVLRPGKGRPGEVNVWHFSLGPHLQGQGLGRALSRSLSRALAQVAPGAVFKAGVIHYAAARAFLHDFQAEIDWEWVRGDEEIIEEMRNALAALGIISPKHRQSFDLAEMRLALGQAKQAAGREQISDAEYLLTKALPVYVQSLAKTQQPGSDDVPGMFNQLFSLLNLQGRVPEFSWALRLQAVPVEQWLGRGLLERLQGSQPRLVVLEADRLDRVPEVLQQARREKRLVEDETILVRIIEQGSRENVECTLLADTLPRLESMSRKFSRLNHTIALNAARLVWKVRLEAGAGKNGKLEIRQLALDPELQDQHLSSGIAAGLKSWLQANLPGIEVVALAKHPNMVRIMAKYFQGEIDWSQVRGETAPGLWGAALKLLDLAEPGQRIDTEMTSIREALAGARVRSGQPDGVSDAQFLMDALARKAAWLQQHPEAFAGQAEACGLPKTNNVFSLQSPGTTIRSWTYFLYQRLFGLLYIRGQVQPAEARTADKQPEASGPRLGADSAGQPIWQGLSRRFEMQSALRRFITLGPWLAAWQWAKSLAGHGQNRPQGRNQRSHPREPVRSFRGAA